MKRDFEFLTELVSDFFSRKAIRETLSAISEFEISGWEKWVQIEFAKFCMAHEKQSGTDHGFEPNPPALFAPFEPCPEHEIARVGWAE